MRKGGFARGGGGGGGLMGGKEGRVLVSCSRAPNYKGRKTAAYIPFSRGEFLDLDVKLLQSLKLHICLCGSLGQYAIHMFH